MVVQRRARLRALLVALLGTALVGFGSPTHALFPVGEGPVAPTGRTATLLVTGEILPHPRVSWKAQEYGRESGRDFDFRPMFDDVRPLIAAADLALCHLEVQLDVPGVSGLNSFPKINAPGEVAEALTDAGFDGCSTASNHATDWGWSS